MSGGRKKKQEEPIQVTINTEEFGEVCQRVHQFLLTRAEDAKEAKEKRDTKKNREDHIEKAKDVFVFVHLMELVDEMTGEIADLRSIISSMGGDVDEGEEGLPQMFSAPKKAYLQ